MVKWSICAQSMTAACRGERNKMWKIFSFLPLTSAILIPNQTLELLIRWHKSRHRIVRALKMRMYLFEVFLSCWEKSIQQQLLIKFSTSELMYQFVPPYGIFQIVWFLYYLLFCIDNCMISVIILDSNWVVRCNHFNCVRSISLNENDEWIA